MFDLDSEEGCAKCKMCAPSGGMVNRLVVNGPCSGSERMRGLWSKVSEKRGLVAGWGQDSGLGRTVTYLVTREPFTKTASGWVFSPLGRGPRCQIVVAVLLRVGRSSAERKNGVVVEEAQ